jgi:PAS domain S-box-containing protein
MREITMQVPDTVPNDGSKKERMAGVTASRQPGFSLTENGWRVLCLGTSLIILVFTVYCLSQGITTIFMHLYYFPIILLAYHYHKKGVILSAVLGLLYVALVTFFTYPDVEVISGALIRFVVFVGIAAVVSFLSETLRKRELERNTIIANSEDGIFVVDISSQMITEANSRGEGMLGFTPGDLVDATLETIWQDADERIRFSDLIKTRGQARNIEAHLTQKNGGTRTVLMSAGVLPENRVVLTVTDITDREYMLTEMRRLSDVRESIISNANVWLMVLDSYGRILEWNLAAEKISGYPAAEVVGGNEVWKRLYPEKNYRKEITGKITGIIKKDTYFENLQTTIVCRDGTQKTILWNTRGLPDIKGVTGHYIAIGVDISDRTRAEQVSREYAEWYSTILRTTRDGYNLVDATGRLIEVNDNYCRMTGFSREELLGRAISDQDADESRDVAVAHLQKILTTGSDRFETRHRTKDGRAIDVEISVVLQAQKKQFIVFVRDITERKRAEKEISDSEKKFQTIADFTADWEYWQGQDKQIIYMSPSCERFTGYPQQDFIADANLMDTIVHPDDLPSVQEHNTAAWKTRETLSTDFRIIHRDGTVRWISHSCRQIYDGEGNAQGRRVSNRDITDRKLLEISLRESEGRLKEILESMIAGVVIIDPATHTIHDLNSIAARMIGADKEEIIGSVCHRYICPAEIGACPITDLNQIVDNSEKVLLTIDGQKIPIIKSVVPITIDHRPYLLESFIDISNLKRAESALLESEEKFRAFFNTSRDCVFITTADGRWVDLNSAAVELFGYNSMEELRQVNIRDLYADPDERARHIAIIRETGFTRNFPINLMKKDGTIINALITSVVRKDRNGNVVGFQGTVRDITELTQIEEALRNSQQILRTVLDTIPVRVFWKDRDLNYLGCNVPFAKDAGFQEPEELIGKDDYEMGWREQAELYRADDQLVINSGKPKTLIEEPQTTPDGRIIWLLTSKTPLHDKSGGVSGVLGAYIDITERKQVEEALAQSEYRYRILAESAQDVIMIIDRDLKFTYMNSFGALQVGKKPEEFIGMPLKALFPLQTFENISAILKKVFETGKPQHFEMEIPLPSSIQWHDSHVVPLLDNMGNIFSVLGISRDITERKRAEEVIKQSIERFRMVMDSIDALVYVADMKTYELLFINKYGKDIWGEIEGKVCWQTIQSGQKGPCPFCTNYRLVDDNGNPTGIYNWEFQNTVNGRWYDCRDSAIRWLDGRLVRMEIATDITGRKQIEEALRESEQKFRDLFENSRDGIVIADTKTQQFVDSNEMFSHMLGYRPEEIKNLGLMDIHPESGRSHAVEIFARMARREINVSENLPVRRKDGTIFFADISAYPISKSNKDYLVGVFRDITERRQAEELRRHFTEELEQQVKSRTQELETSLNEKVVLLREVHHRVRNNFQIIISLLSLQSRSIGDEKVTRAMKESQNRIQAMSFVHERLYTSTDLARIDLEPYVKYMTSQLFNLFTVRPGTISLNLDVKNIFVDINTAIPLGLVINELITNSLKHAFPKGRKGQITISIHDDQKGLTLSYQDNGVGFAGGFDWRTTENLGFRLIRGLIDQLNGNIEQESCEGTCFIIRVKKNTDEEGEVHGTFNPVPE